jgi:pectinesterase
MQYGITLILFFTFLHNSTFGNTKESHTTIALIGDSTVTETKGWGRTFQSKFNNKVKIYNFAASGRSSKSWYNEKRLTNVLKLKPEYVFIQFGHNGQPGKGPERETDPSTSYKKYLTLYIKKFKKIGTKPIIVSSLTRKNSTVMEKLNPF